MLQVEYQPMLPAHKKFIINKELPAVITGLQYKILSDDQKIFYKYNQLNNVYTIKLQSYFI
jgi:hypothetical protein